MKKFTWKGLQEDIKSDIKSLDATIAKTEDVIRNGQSILDQSKTEKPSLSKVELVALVVAILDRPNFYSKNATFSSLKSSANFHLLRDIGLKNLLFEYDQQYQSLKAVESAELQATIFITGPYIIKYIPLSDAQRSAYWLENFKEEIVLRNVEFMNNIVLRMANRDELLKSYVSILKTARQIEGSVKYNLENW